LTCLKHINTINKKTVKDTVTIGLDMFSTDKTKLKENTNHLYYNNGSCYYLSNKSLMKNYVESSQFCYDIGTNNFSSLYEFKNKDEYDFLIKKIRQLGREQFVQFYIGLKITEYGESN
jgi:hypothetical protein